MITGYPIELKYGGDIFIKNITDELGKLLKIKKIRSRYYASNPITHWTGILTQSILSFLSFPNVIVLQGMIEAQTITFALTPFAKRIMIVHHLERRSSSHQVYQEFIWRKYIDALKKADLIITVSQSSKVEIEKICLHPDRIKVIYPALNEFQLPQVHKDIDFLIIGRAGKFPKLKEIVHEIRKRKQDSVIFMIGPIDPHIPELDYLGFVSEVEKLRLMARAKVLLHPSDREGYSITVAEAVTAYLPAVVWDIHTFRELYSNAEGVELVKAFDVTAFTEAAIRSIDKQVKKGTNKRTWSDAAVEFNYILHESRTLSPQKGS